MRKVFQWSYQRLPAEQARLFRRLGLHPGPDISLPAAAAVAELDVPATRRLLDGLADTHLVELATRGRYRMHDLLRVHAADLAHHHDGAESCGHTIRAVHDWYTNYASACDELVFPANPRVPVTISRTLAAPNLDRTQATEWLETERANLLAVLTDAIQHGSYSHAMVIADSMRFLYLAGSWDEYLEVDTSGIAMAGDHGDRRTESYFRNRRSEAYIRLRRWADAQADLDKSLSLARAVGDRLRHGWALNGLGLLAIQQNQFEKGLTYLREGLPLSRGVDTGRLEAVIEGNLGEAFISLKSYRRALEHAQRSLALRLGAGDLHGEPYALHMLARARFGLGEHEMVISLCRKAIGLGRNVGNPAQTVAEPLDTLAKALQRIGRVTEAITCWLEAAEVFDHHGRSDQADQVRRRVRSAHLGTKSQ